MQNYPLLDTNLSACSAATTVLEASSRVLAADECRIHRDKEALIIQIPPHPSAPFSFFVHGVLSRSARPQRPACCPLCLGAVQAAGQHYASVELPGGPMLILANKYPYLPECLTWAMCDHVPQLCGEAIPNGPWQRILDTMLCLCQELPGQVFGFNEVVGNSLDHLHLVSHRPPDGHGPYAAQQLAAHLGLRNGIAHLGPENGYPTDVWRISSPDAAAVLQAALTLLAQWQKIGGISASANCATTMENDLPTLYIFPRSRILTPWGWAAKPAIMEMLGVFIATNARDVERIRQGTWGHGHFSQVLSSLRPLSARAVNCELEL